MPVVKHCRQGTQQRARAHAHTRTTESDQARPEAHARAHTQKERYTVKGALSCRQEPGGESGGCIERTEKCGEGAARTCARVAPGDAARI